MANLQDCIELVNKNLEKALLAEFKTKFSKEINDKLKDVYTKHLHETLNSVKSDIDEFNERCNVFENLSNLNDWIDQANEACSAQPDALEAKWRFFDDTSKSLNALIFENKKQYIEELTKINAECDDVCKQLESTLKKENEELTKFTSQLDQLEKENRFK